MKNDSIPNVIWPSSHNGWLPVYLCIGMIIALPNISTAEVVVDGTVSNVAGGTPITGPVYDINASYGTASSNNLFHSFTTFNIGAGETANFSGPANVTNVIGRVTGGSPSTIDGTINNTISGANLWLVNSSGLIFGQDATINVSGSFYASTGDDVRFDTTAPANFSISGDNNTILTAANPIGFGFISANTAGISANSTAINVGAGETVSLVGGDVVLTDMTLGVRDGRINIAAVAEAGQVVFTTPTDNQVSAIDTGATSQFANISLENSTLTTALPDVSGNASNGGGNIYIVGGNIYAGPGSRIKNDTANSTAGVIHVKGVDINLDRALIQSRALGAEKGADIVIRTTNLTVQNDRGAADTTTAGVVSLAAGGSVGGDIDIESSGTTRVTAANEGIGVSGIIRSGLDGTAPNAPTKFGDIKISGGNLVVEQGGNIYSDVTGQAANITNGSININPSQSVTVSGASSEISVEAFGLANTTGVELNVDTSQLTIADGGRISADTFSGSTGVGVTVTAANVLITGLNSEIATETRDTTTGGGITMQVTDTLTVTDSGHITSDVFGTGLGSDININQPDSQTGLPRIGNKVVVSNRGFISASTKEDGDAGTINIDAREIEVSGTGESFTQMAQNTANGNLQSGIFSVAGDAVNFSPNVNILGRGGNINLTAERVSFENGGLSSASAINGGNAGNINISVSDAVTLTDSAIQTKSVLSAGGEVTINAGRRVDLVNSEINAEAMGVAAENDGGNILIGTAKVATLDNSALVARANAGNGGNVSIQTAFFIQTVDSSIDVSSQKGIAGEIQIASIHQDVNVLPVVPQPFLNVAALLGNPCAIEALQERSSLMVEATKPASLQLNKLVSAQYLAANVSEATPVWYTGMQLACR